MKKILFVSHDATLTGAPILLLHLIKLLKKHNSFQISLVLKNGFGTLIDDFALTVNEMLIWKNPYSNSFMKKIAFKLIPYLKSYLSSDKKIQKLINESDIIFSNTITNGDFLNSFQFKSSHKIISYIHELEMATKFFTKETDLKSVKLCTTEFLVPSQAVEQYLISSLGIAANKINRLNYYIPYENNNDAMDIKKTTLFIVGLTGTLDWRKGADILSIVVASFFKTYPTSNLKFIWQGVDENSIEAVRTIYELKKINLDTRVSFNLPQKNISEFYNSIDLLLLISKEDPYPLVVLEAASYRKPSICFQNSGGATEFITEDAGDIVPYLDIGFLTEILYSYYSDRDKCKRKGETAYNKYRTLHVDENLILRQFDHAIGSKSLD